MVALCGGKLMRLVDHTVIAIKDLRRQFVRSSLTIFAVIISTVILVIMAAISIGGQQAIIDQFGSDESLTAIAVTPNQSNGTLSPYGNVQEVNASAGKLSDETVERLLKLPHVQTVTPRAHIWEFNNFSLQGSNKHFVAQAEGIPSDAPLSLKAGTHFASNDDKHVAILGYEYAKELGYEDNPNMLIGKTVQIVTQKGYRGSGAAVPGPTATRQENETFNQTETTLQAAVVGITEKGKDQNSLFIPLGWAYDVRTAQYREPGGLKTVDQLSKDGYTTIHVQADMLANVKAVSAAIQQLGYGQVSTLSQVERLQQFSTMMWAILGAVAVIAVVAAALGVVNTMLMAVSERRYAIGVWRACGARKGFIVTLFLVEAGLLGMIGGLIGVGVGIFASRFVNEYVNSILQAQGLAVTNIAVVPVWLMAGTIALTTLFGILAGLYPAYQAARQDPSRILSSGQ